VKVKIREASLLAVSLILVGAPASANAASYPPSRDPNLAAPPSPPPPPTACTATGTWFETGGYTGDGSWTTTDKKKCKVPGTWTDAFGYTWKIKKSGHQLTGSVNYNGIPPCEYQVWPVTGTTGKKKTFTVTATNPDSSDPACVQQFGYDLQIQ